MSQRLGLLLFATVVVAIIGGNIAWWLRGGRYRIPGRVRQGVMREDSPGLFWLFGAVVAAQLAIPVVGLLLPAFGIDPADVFGPPQPRWRMLEAAAKARLASLSYREAGQVRPCTSLIDYGEASELHGAGMSSSAREVDSWFNLDVRSRGAPILQAARQACMIPSSADLSSQTPVRVELNFHFAWRDHAWRLISP